MSQSRILVDPLAAGGAHFDVCIELLLCVIKMFDCWFVFAVSWLCKCDDCLDNGDDDDE